MRDLQTYLGMAKCQTSDDPAQHDPDLLCTECGERVCTVEDGDTLDVLARVIEEHAREAGHLT